MPPSVPPLQLPRHLLQTARKGRLSPLRVQERQTFCSHSWRRRWQSATHVAIGCQCLGKSPLLPGGVAGTQSPTGADDTIRTRSLLLLPLLKRVTPSGRTSRVVADLGVSICPCSIVIHRPRSDPSSAPENVGCVQRRASASLASLLGRAEVESMPVCALALGVTSLVEARRLSSLIEGPGGTALSAPLAGASSWSGVERVRRGARRTRAASRGARHRALLHLVGEHRRAHLSLGRTP